MATFTQNLCSVEVRGQQKQLTKNVPAAYRMLSQVWLAYNNMSVHNYFQQKWFVLTLLY